MHNDDNYCVFLVSVHSSIMFITCIPFIQPYYSWCRFIYGVLVFMYLQINDEGAGLCIVYSTSCFIVIKAIVHT